MNSRILVLIRPIMAFLLLAGLTPYRVYSAEPARREAGKPLAKITVEAGSHTRIDTPVSVALEGMSESLSQTNVCLQEIGPSSNPQPIPAQIEQDNPPHEWRINPPRLWWILPGTTAAGTTRSFQLVKEAVETPDVRLIKDDSILQLQVGGADVLRYNHAIVPAPAGQSKLFDRSGFIHPLWSPTGDILTDIHPADHIHHLGIWMPWTKTKFEDKDVDFWNLGEGQGTVRFVKFLSTTSGPVYGGFEAEQDHVALKTSAGEKTVLKEVWDVRVYIIGGSK